MLDSLYEQIVDSRDLDLIIKNGSQRYNHFTFFNKY